MDLQPRLAGELLELRPLREDDFDDLWAVGSDPLVWEQHPAKERSTPEGFRAYFADHLASGGALAVVDRRDGRVIGVTRYAFHDPERSEVEIGWTFLARAHWGGAVNGELKRLMLEHAFRHVESVVFLIDADNIRSQRAVEKLGAARTGETRRGLVVYAIKP